MYNETLGRISFVLTFIGFNITFFPMHQLGFQGMPRRIFTYDSATGWGDMNLLATVGAGILLLGGVVFVYNVFSSLRGGPVALPDPWGADTLDWSTTSPPPAFNFLYQPVVQGRYARWMRKEPEVAIVGLPSNKREVLVTEVLDAEPAHLEEIPKPTIWTFWTAVAVSALMVGSMFTPWAVVWGALPVAFCGTMWFRSGLPSREEEPPDPARFSREKVA
jgi:cytochrome c oxidase subunit 1